MTRVCKQKDSRAEPLGLVFGPIDSCWIVATESREPAWRQA